MALQDISHKQPLVFNEDASNQSGDTCCCATCEEEELGPTFSCAECVFYLHKKCAEAPTEIHHPFHRDHPLVLLPPSAYGVRESVQCSCEFYLHINCALLPRDTAGNFIETRHVAHRHPLILIGNYKNQPRYLRCSGCLSALVDISSYACVDCQIFFHKKCLDLELPADINHPCLRIHLLILESETEWRDCNLCGSNHREFFYRCSLCSIDIHIKWELPPPIIEDKANHEHPFSLLLRPNPFDCDTCGTPGIMCPIFVRMNVHKECISLLRIIRINLHNHPISRNFSFCIDRHDTKTWECRICYKKVDMEQGSYYCSKPDCDFFIHVNCAIDNKSSYDVLELENEDEVEEFNLLSNKSTDSIIHVIKEIQVGEDVIAAEIIHFCHKQHILTCNNESKDSKHCDGCVLPRFFFILVLFSVISFSTKPVMNY